MEARHILFLFDSCLSGTIFRRETSPIILHISSFTSRSVRQFITAGSAGEEISDRSVFIDSFVKALSGEADINKDDYVTGTELGMYLHGKVVESNIGQTPQYGKLKDPYFDEGEFVFVPRRKWEVVPKPPIGSLEYYVTATPANLTSQHSIDLDRSVVYDIEKLQVRARLMSDKELNDLYPDRSYREHSTNPYTYGTWRDSVKGYTPPRFTVFKIAVFNYPFAKVELDPAKAVLETDLGGKYRYYDIRASDADNSFEEYYKKQAEPGPNVERWFTERMGLVRRSLYRRQELIFKGDYYEGMLVFDPLPEDVTHIKLTIKDFVLRFDSYNHPVDTQDITFEFDIEQGVYKIE